MTRLRKAIVLFSAIFVVALLVTMLGVVAARGSGRGSTVAVSEKEMAISVKPAVVAAGRVTFVVRNTGTIEHEMVVVRGAKKLKVKGFEAEETVSPGEVEGVKPDKAKRLTLNLKPGKYLLICNIPGHYMLGMSTVLTVR
jgi:uncharacterized cupredoxin-like copper-binding protein